MSSDNFRGWRKPNNNQPENLADQAFEQHLAQLPVVEARPQFRAKLRAQLLGSTTRQISQSPKTARFSFLNRPRWILVGVAVAIALVAFSVTLFFASKVTEIPVANAFDKVYDPDSQAYVNSNEAAQALGFAVNAPSYLPEAHNDYQVESALAPLVFTNTDTTSLLSDSPTRTLQVSLIPKKSSQNKPQFEIYEMRVPFNFVTVSQNPVVLRAQRFSPITVQGVPGYFVEGRLWRLVFQAHLQAGRPIPTRKPGATVPIRTPLPAVLAPHLRSNPFIIGRAASPDLNNPRVFVEFVPNQKWSAGAKTILWQKDGVLFMLVSDQTASDDQMQQVAQSFQEIQKPGQKS